MGEWLQENPWATALIGATQPGSRALGALAMVEQRKRQREALDLQRQYFGLAEQRAARAEEGTRADETEIGAVDTALAGAYDDPVVAMKNIQGVPTQRPKGRAAKVTGLGKAAERRGAVAAARAMQQIPGQPAVEAEMGEVGTWPGAIRYTPPPPIREERLVPPGPADMAAWARTPEDERTQQGMAPPAWSKRFVEKPGEGPGAVDVLRPPQASSLVTKEATAPRNPTLFEAIGSLPESERSYALPSLLSHHGAFKPPKDAAGTVDHSAAIAESLKALDAHFAGQPLEVQQQAGGFHGRAKRAYQAAAKDPKHFDNATNAEKDYYNSITGYLNTQERMRIAQQSLQVRRGFLQNAQAQLAEAIRRNDIDAYDRGVDNIRGEIASIRQDIAFWMNQNPGDLTVKAMIKELEHQLMLATQLVQGRQREFRERTKRIEPPDVPGPAGTTPPVDRPAAAPSGAKPSGTKRTIKLPSGKVVEVEVE